MARFITRNGWNIRNLVRSWQVAPDTYRTDFTSRVFTRRRCRGVEWRTPNGKRVRIGRARLAMQTAHLPRRGGRVVVNLNIALGAIH